MVACALTAYPVQWTFLLFLVSPFTRMIAPTETLYESVDVFLVGDGFAIFLTMIK